MSPSTQDISQVAASSALREILGAMPQEEFFNHYWGRRPLHVRAGEERIRTLLGGDFTPEDFVRMAQETELTRRPGEHMDAVTGRENAPSLHISAAQIRPLHAAGMTLLSSIRTDRLSSLAFTLKRELGHPGPVTTAACWSPREEGVRLHFDATDTFVFQAQGAKNWWVGRERVMRSPSKAADVTPEGRFVYSRRHVPQDWELPEFVDPEAVDLVRLEAGDVLYVPAGILHRTAAEAHSLSVMVSFTPETMIPALLRALGDVLLSRPEWRHVPAAMGGEGSLPGELKEFFAARIVELRRAIRELDPAGVELKEAWAGFVRDPGRQFGPPRRQA